MNVQKEVWEECDLINFSYSSPANSVPLCPSCHDQFDNICDPGLVFFPSDLAYFIEFELKDQQQRRPGGARKTPSANDYRTHQAKENKVPPQAPGGLYRRVFLKDYLHDGIMPVEMLQMFASEKVWHGSPMASMRRAIGMLGSVRIGILDPHIIHQLHQLQSLYFSGAGCSRLKLLYGPKTLGKRAHDSDSDDDSTEQKRPRFRQDLPTASDNINANASRPTDTTNPTEPAENFSDAPRSSNASKAYCDWVLGPQSSSNGIIQRFAPVFSHPNIIDILSA